MLTIKRKATVVPMKQASGQNCGRNCLGLCCLPGAKLPLYNFARRNSIKDTSNDAAEYHVVAGDSSDQISLLDSVILAKWEDCAARGLFRYDVTTCETKVLEGESGFVAQLNEGRHTKKRPTEFRVDQVLQPFDKKKFNFTKVGQEEVLFSFEESGGNEKSNYVENASIEGSAPNVVAINVSPIEYGHVLLVPRVLDCIPQRVEPDTLLLALHMAAEVNNPYFRLGYNSLGAFATINHLHYQAYYLNVPFAIERAPTVNLAVNSHCRGLKMFELTDYPVRGLVYEAGSSLDELAEVVSKACMVLQNNNQPFNLLIADSGARVFLIPQCFAERQARGEVEQMILDTQVNPAVWEISGHIVLKRKMDFEMATEDYAWKLLAEVSLPEGPFEEIKKMCLKVAEEKDNYVFPFDSYENIFSLDESMTSTGYRVLGKHQLKVRKSMDLKSLCQECLLPLA